jgi:ABC-type transport system involved in multi-copper enzyme maturation permease subunit
MIALARSEATKLLSARSSWILAFIAIFATWPMAWSNSAANTELPANSELLFSSVPIPPEYQGFEMAGLGYVLVVILAAIWAGSEYGDGKQIRTTLLATPKRLRVFFAKAALLALLVAVIGFATMTGTIVITHTAAESGINPLALTPAIWANIGGVTLAWTLTALIAFAVGTLARSTIVPLILIVPLIIGVGDFLAGFWDGARYLPTTAGAAMYSDASTAFLLTPAVGGLVQAAWTVVLLIVAAIVFARRDL